MSSILRFDTYKMRRYAERLKTVNQRLVLLDARFDGLYTKLPITEIWSIVKADASVSYSSKILACRLYLLETAAEFERIEERLSGESPSDFQTPVLPGVIYDVGIAVKKSAEKVVSLAEDLVTDAIISYNSYGAVYKAVEYGKAALTAVFGVCSIVGGVATILGTAGGSAPVSVLMIIHGCNDVYNSIMDITAVATEQYDEVGHNALKEKLAEGGGVLGELLGNEDAGEIAGECLYYGSDLIASLDQLDLSYQKVRQAPDVNFGKVKTELQEIKNLEIPKNVFSMDADALRYNAKLASYHFEETTKAVSATSSVWGVGKAAVDTGKTVDKILSTISQDANYENPVLEVVDTASDVSGFVGKFGKVATAVTEFVFE